MPHLPLPIPPSQPRPQADAGPQTRPASAPIVMGIDPSLAGTGLVVLDGAGREILRRRAGTPSGPPREKRLMVIANTVNAAARDFQPGLVVLEGTSMAQNNWSSDVLAGLHWLLRCGISVTAPGARIVALPPTSLKLWAAGKGTADKERMAFMASQRWGVTFPNSDLCDAYCLARWGLAFLAGEVELPGKQQKKRR